MLHGLGVEMAEALAESGTNGSGTEWGFVDEDGPTTEGLFRQQYRAAAIRGATPPVPTSRTTPGSAHCWAWTASASSERGDGLAVPARADHIRHHLPPPPGQVLRRPWTGRPQMVASGSVRKRNASECSALVTVSPARQRPRPETLTHPSGRVRRHEPRRSKACGPGRLPTAGGSGLVGREGGLAAAQAAASAAYRPPGTATSSSWVPSSARRPPSTTPTRSARAAVDSRWAMTMTRPALASAARRRARPPPRCRGRGSTSPRRAPARPGRPARRGPARRAASPRPRAATHAR